VTTFQSYLSPIQTSRVLLVLRGCIHFQSYLSPIQTIWQARIDPGRVNAFNPTLVQFKRRVVELLGVRHDPFNPTLVQFKRERWAGDPENKLSFNPTLVQFKRGRRTTRTGRVQLSILP